jgi:hypothetical protein
VAVADTGRRITPSSVDRIGMSREITYNRVAMLRVELPQSKVLGAEIGTNASL